MDPSEPIIQIQEDGSQWTNNTDKGRWITVIQKVDSTHAKFDENLANYFWKSVGENKCILHV